MEAPGGALFVCNCKGNTISRVVPGGDSEVFAQSDLLNCPNGITRGPDGALYVANFTGGLVAKVDADGAVSPFATIPGGGNGHIVYAAGSFFVTGFRSNRLYRVSMEGEVEPFAGSGAYSSEDGPADVASFSSPNGIAYDATRDVLYINDYLTPFLQRMTAPKKSVVRRVVFPNLTQRVRGALQREGVDAAEAAYRRYKAARPARFTEIETNILGYGLLQSGNVPAALRIFELIAESYPASFNAWDSLAEGHKLAGNRERAIEYYRKSLELNPANDNAVRMLEELGEE